MRTNLRLTLAVSALVIAATALAQDAPTSGLVYNKSETSSLTYRCGVPKSGVISCDFVQTAVRKKSSYSDLPRALEQGRKEIQRSQVFSVEDCKLNKSIVDVLEGRSKAPKQEVVDALSAVQRNDALAFSRKTAKYCAQRTEENYLDVVRVAQDKDRRTCKVSSNSFTQTFRVASESTAPSSVWVTGGEPDGPCGVVRLDRFEPELITLNKTKFTNWKYVSRKAITNPTGELFPGASCGGFDEGTYIYDWRAEDRQVSCDYIEFSPL